MFKKGLKIFVSICMALALAMCVVNKSANTYADEDDCDGFFHYGSCNEDDTIKEIIQEPTLEEPGIVKYTCRLCGESYEEVYTFQDLIVEEYWDCYDNVASNNDEGIYTEESYKVYEDALGHAEELVYSYLEYVSKLPYTEGAKIYKNALETLQAARAGLVKVGEESVDPATCEHVWDEDKIVEEATEDTWGLLEYTCIFCGTTKQERYVNTGILANKLYELIFNYKGGYYTAESWENVVDVFDQAKTVLNKVEVGIDENTQKEITNAYKLLLEAEAKLVKVGEESADPATCNHDYISKVIQEGDIGKCEIVEWTCSKCGASALLYYVYYNDLGGNVTRIESNYNEEDYTAESWKNLKTLINQAYDFLTTVDSINSSDKAAVENGQKTADEMLEQLLEAEANLVKIGEDKKDEEVVVPDQDEETTPVTPDTPNTPDTPVTPVTPDTPSEGGNTTGTVVVPNTGIYGSSAYLLGIAGIALVVALKKKKED